MHLGPILEDILAGRELSSETAVAVMGSMMDGEASDVEIAAILVALRAKGVTGPELAAFVRVMRSRAVLVPIELPGLVDTCGTGGGIPSFNISTAAAFVAAAAGVPIAKHGNRAMSSRCGSADVLEALGSRLTDDPNRLCKLVQDVGLAFLFAPSHHPAMRHVGPVRKALGVRTVMNQLGPLSNPAGARRQVIGVYDPGIASAMAHAAVELGCERVWVAHGADGLDEISPCAPTHVWEGDRTSLVEPSDFGMDPLPREALAPGETVDENAAILREAITEPRSPRSLAIVPSAATAIYLGGLASTLLESANIARTAIADGAAIDRLERFVEATNTP